MKFVSVNTRILRRFTKFRYIKLNGIVPQDRIGSRETFLPRRLQAASSLPTWFDFLSCDLRVCCLIRSQHSNATDRRMELNPSNPKAAQFSQDCPLSCPLRFSIGSGRQHQHSPSQCHVFLSLIAVVADLELVHFNDLMPLWPNRLVTLRNCPTRNSIVNSNFVLSFSRLGTSLLLFRFRNIPHQISISYGIDFLTKCNRKAKAKEQARWTDWSHQKNRVDGEGGRWTLKGSNPRSLSRFWLRQLRFLSFYIMHHHSTVVAPTMFLPLVFLILLIIPFTVAAPTNNVTLPSNLQLLSKRNIIRCFENPRGANIVKPIYEDCHRAMQQAYCDPKLWTVPMHFSSDPTKGFELPQTYESGTCKVSIGLRQNEDIAESSIAEIAEVTVEVLIACVNGASGLGGVSTAGNDDLLQVIVTGKIAPSRRPAPLFTQMCMTSKIT